MTNIAAADLQNIRIPGGMDIDAVHLNPDLQCLNVHCWVLSNDGKSVLVKKRAASVLNFPNRYDVSLAGHIDADENPLEAMLREIREEGELNVAGRLIEPPEALYVEEQGKYPNGQQYLHNQTVYLYFAVLDPKEIHRHTHDADVNSFEWWNLDTFALRAINPTSVHLVPHPSWYYHLVAKRLYELRRIHAKIDA